MAEALRDTVPPRAGIIEMINIPGLEDRRRVEVGTQIANMAERVAAQHSVVDRILIGYNGGSEELELFLSMNEPPALLNLGAERTPESSALMDTELGFWNNSKGLLLHSRRFTRDFFAGVEDQKIVEGIEGFTHIGTINFAPKAE